MKRKSYTLDEFLYRDLPMGLSAGIIAAMVVGGLTRRERNEMNVTIEEQRAEIDNLIGEKVSCAADDTFEDGGSNKAVSGGGVAQTGAEADLTTNSACSHEVEKLENDLIFANMRACSYFVDAIEFASMRRNNCATAKNIHQVIDVARDYCVRVMGMVKTPQEKGSAQNALDKLEKLHKHHWISPEPCNLD